MKKKFTFMMAAVMLLTMILPWNAVGQTRSSYTIEFKSTGTNSDGSTAISSIDDIVKTGTEYIKTITDATYVYKGKLDMGVKVGRSSNPSAGSFVMNLATEAQGKVSKIYIYAAKYGTDTGNIQIRLNGNATQNYNYYVNNSDLTSEIKEYELSINSTIDAVTSIRIGTASKRAYIHSIKVEMVSTDPSCEADQTSWDFGSVHVGQSASKTFRITTANLTGDIDLAVYDDDAFSVSPSKIPADATSTDVTVTFHPTIIPNQGWEDALVINSDDFSYVDLIDLTGAAHCNAPETALAYTTPINLTLTGADVSTTLTPTDNTGNGGAITYTLTTNPGGGSLSGNTFTATATGTFVVTATQALNTTTWECGDEKDITIVVNPNAPVCTIDPASYDFGTVLTNSNNTYDFTVTTANLESALTVAIDNMDKGFSVSPNLIAQDATSTTVTVTYAPTAESTEVTATLTISGGGLASNVTATVTGAATDGYTVTFDAGTGECTTTEMTGLLPNEVITLPLASTVTAPEGWTFAGWSETNVTTQTTTAPTFITSYTVTENATLYAVYSKTEENSDTQSFVFETIAAANNWQDATAYTPVQLGSITITATGGGNNAKYYTSDKTWRMYNGGSVSITTSSGAITEVSSNPSTSFTISNGSASQSFTATTKFKSISVTYGSSTTNYATSPAAKVATPSIQIAGVSTGAANSYYETATVTIGCATSEAAIHYTTNGDEPTASSTLYTEPFAVTSTSTIKAIAVKANFNDSDVASQEVIIVDPNVATFTNGVYTSLTSQTEFNIWNGYSVTGDQVWSWNNNSSAARMSGYVSSTNYDNEDWLITPKMLVENGKLAMTFQCAGAYGNADMLVAKYSTNYPGYGNPLNYTWTTVTTDPALPYNGNTSTYSDITCNVSGLENNTNVCFAIIYTSSTTKAGTALVKNFIAKQYYPVTYAHGEGTGSMTDSNSPYVVGATVTVLANGFIAPEGQVFSQWLVNEGPVKYAPNDEFTMGAAAVTLTALWITPCTVQATMADTDAEPVYVYDAGNKSYKVAMSSAVSALGSCDITEYGFVYSKTETTPTIGDTKVTVGNEYTTAGTEFDAEIANATGTYYVRSFATNGAGTAYSATVTVEVPNIYPQWTITYSTNGTAEAAITTVDKGDDISTLITPTVANIPAGFTFKGWYAGEYALSDIAPDFVEVGDAIGGNLELKAVFAIAETSEVEQQLEMTAENFTELTGSYGTYTHTYTEATIEVYSCKQSSAFQINNNKTIYFKNTTAMPGYITKFVVAWDGTPSNNTITMYANGNSVASTSSTEVGAPAAGTPQTITIENASANNYKYFYMDGMTVGGGCKITSFKIYYMGTGTTYSNYCTSVEILSGNVSGTQAGACTVASTGATVKANTLLNVTGVIVNAYTADKLVIEDGGQLITTSTGVKATFKKTTTASTEAKTATTYWYAISSPIDEIAISTFATGTHNVYSYIEKSHYWNEYRGAENITLGTAPFTKLANGRGYLYRSTASGIDFKGDVNIEDATYTLSYTAENGDLAGFNLIGNPFSYNIYKGVDIPNTDLEGNFYTLTPSGGWELGYDSGAAEPTEIKPNTGILVQAKSTADGHDLIIAKTRNGGVAKYENDQISFKVENSDYYDVACVQFKDGRGLNKIEHRNAEIPMLYIMNNGENFGAANMPDNTDVINLGFEAKTMGQYTISLKAEGQYSYMHLVDKLTGNDIDMLVEDSYTFVGTPNDRNDRFVLRLNYNAAGIDTESDIFAYQSGNEIIVNGEGTLEVFDVTGRKVMATTINGVQTVNGLNNGFYIFRLNEKTQKIVVR